MTDAVDDTQAVKRCGARTRSGGVCKLPAGSGTDHNGHGRCRFHGGATRNGKVTAARELARSLAGETDIDPNDALLKMVRRAAYWQDYCEWRVAELTKDEMLVQQRRERLSDGDGDSFVEVTSSAELHAAIRAELEARRDLVKFSTAAVTAGIAERQVRLAEDFASQLSVFARVLLDGLGVADHPDAPLVVKRAFAELEAGTS